MKLLKCVPLLLLLLALSGCGGAAALAPKPGPGGTGAPPAAFESPAPTAAPSAAPSTAPSPVPTAAPTTALPAVVENEALWAKLDKELESEDYSSIAAQFARVQSPSEDLTAMYRFAMYNICGQDGDDEKSLQYLYQIPAGYRGRHADLIAYWKFVHESYTEGQSQNITFDEYKRKYYKSGKGAY
ncbi:hypothetical protein J2Z22_003202 [Paenibacillus forsythiae]|uniref:Lipoprotein n=1 Tax=Paenibacillus forsythiae TaxID=365616 RepID=A0ABU3H9Z9_9BACL|nr:hypothetical protein [Paenibacillus forsythiae]MDT3427639.1 hypothetical protein [Paenibacillus forsythiae]